MLTTFTRYLRIFTGLGVILATVGAQQRDISLTGRVTTAEGVPIQADLIVVDGKREIRVMSYRTDSQGHYSIRIPAIESGEVPIIAKTEGYLSTEKVLTPQNIGKPLNFTLTKAGQVTCKVTDENGLGIADATVSVHYPNRGVRSLEFIHELGKQKTDGYGYVTLPAVATATPFLVLAASDELPLSSSALMTISGKTDALCNVKMSRKGQAIQGKVTYSDGSPASGALVRIRATGNRESFLADERDSIAFVEANTKSVRVNPDGSYSVRGLPLGSVIVIAEQGAARASKREITVSPGQPSNLDIILP